ncbi:MAG: LamG domain-containing protein [Bacteroidia bacterium]
MIVLLVLIIVACFGFVVYESKTKQTLAAVTSFNSLEAIIVGVAVSYLLYRGFFEMADYIRSFNIKFPHDRFIPPARAASYEYDGVEGYVLYGLMFVNIIISIGLVGLISKLKNRTFVLVIYGALTLAAIFYFLEIGFVPPMTNYKDYKDNTPFIVIIALLITGLFFVLHKYLTSKQFYLFLAIFLIPVCFIATEPISVFDYSFILSPSLRLIQGNALSDIYFQYDLFLSLLAALWMKLNIDLNLFQVLGQLSFYIMFIALFWFSKRFYINKLFALFIVILLLITRYYAIMHEPVAIFQVTPLRLELWLILLFLIYKKGVYHWINAVVLGLLLMLHKNFGLLYTLAYYQLIITLFIVDFVALKSTEGYTKKSLFQFLQKQFKLNVFNFFIVVAFVGISIVMFNGFFPKSAILYQQIGVGMIQISTKSFYWFIPPILSVCFALLLKNKSKLHVSYYHTGLMIVFFTIANSIYFFGRSHEHNILNIATSLVLLLFLFLDLIGSLGNAGDNVVVKSKAKKAVNETSELYKYVSLKRNALIILPVVFIVATSFYYSDKINHKFKTQYKNIKKAQFIYPLEVPTDLASVKKITNNSDSVYFLNYQDDFMFYYYGNYKPVGYFSPCATWILKNDLIPFVQGLLDRNYYVVTTDMMRIAELLPEIKYNNVISDGRYSALKRDNVKLLLPVSKTNELVHIGITSPLGKNGITQPTLKLNNDFTVELLIKPEAQQVENSSILVNAMTDSVGPSGFTLQQNGPYHNQFLFAYGGGKAWTPPAMFMLQANEWNYIVVAVQSNTIKVFNNGKLVASEKADFSIKNIDVPLVIGNGIGRKNEFNGWIKEVKIENNTITEQEIINNYNLLKGSL